MEEPIPYAKNVQLSRPTNRGKSLAHFLCKACFFALIIVLVPIFPSQAPDFISESVITKFWELIHLLFIGIAVSYGLFCRRNVEVEIETESKFDSLQRDMSRMFHVSSRLEEDENLCGFDEKRVIQNPNRNCNLSVRENGAQNSTIQAWNSLYFQGEPVVVVARPDCGFGEFNISGSVVDYKPLGLPVRSLKSSARKREKRESLELGSVNESGLGSVGSDKSFDESRDEKFVNLGCRNLEHRFDETLASPSPIPWRSRSIRMDMRENLGPISQPAYFRPLSVDETQFESLGTVRTPSLRSTVSFSSRASSASSSQGDDSPSDSVASEVMDSKVEDEGKGTGFQVSYASSCSPSPLKTLKRDVSKLKISQGSSASGSQSPPKPMDDKASTSALHSRVHSFDSFYENELRGPKDYLKELSESRKDDISDFKEPETSSLKLDVKNTFWTERVAIRRQLEATYCLISATGQ